MFLYYFIHSINSLLFFLLLILRFIIRLDDKDISLSKSPKLILYFCSYTKDRSRIWQRVSQMISVEDRKKKVITIK